LYLTSNPMAMSTLQLVFEPKCTALFPMIISM
jgi:hypothetical protein